MQLRILRQRGKGTFLESFSLTEAKDERGRADGQCGTEPTGVKGFHFSWPVLIPGNVSKVIKFRQDSEFLKLLFCGNFIYYH